MAAAAGTSHVTFLLTGEGPRPCTLRGYPSISLFGASGAGGAGAGSSLGIQAIQLGPAPQTVTVSAGHSAAFVLSISEVPVNGSGCRQAASLQVTPPGGSGALSIPAGFPVCGGTVGVYPVTTAP